MKKLDGWQGSALTIGGRPTLLNSSLRSFPTYPISMHLLLPKRLQPSFKEWIKQEKDFSCKGGKWFRNHLLKGPR